MSTDTNHKPPGGIFSAGKCEEFEAFNVFIYVLLIACS
jgi:hypothetical protein